MTEYRDQNLSQWDNYFPPLNLWNYNLCWRWHQEWQDKIEKDLTSQDKDC